MSAPGEQPADATLRSPAGLAMAIVIAAAIAALPAIPAVHRVLGVDVVDVAIAMAGFVVVMLGATLAYRLGARRYRLWSRIETVVIQVCVLWLVYASGRGDSFFWLLALVHVMILGGGYGDQARFEVGALTVVWSGLALAFALGRHDLGAAALTIAIGATGLYVYWLMTSIRTRLTAADAERARLAAELAESRVREERQRIARDIHDGVGADLAALDWRLRGLRETGTPGLRAELDALTARLAQGSDELRTIVWALRTPSRRWSELVAYLRERTAELAGDRVALRLVDQGDGGIAARPGELALDFMRAVLELVRNAVRHADAREVAVTLGSSPRGLHAIVEDDGRGLPPGALDRDEGGLANLRARIARAAGTLQVEHPARGGVRIELLFKT